jgi:acetaldehyde dehydrogenase (acetylating)
LKKPAYRIVVNTPTTHGSIGLTTGLDPSMTLGCGGWGGNITSDNISPRHLINIKRLAYETTPAVVRQPAVPAAAPVAAPGKPGLPRPPAPPPAAGGIAADVLARRIDEFLGSRGYKAPVSTPTAGASATPEKDPAPTVSSGDRAYGSSTKEPKPAIEEKPTDFVCEDDVRQAVRQGRKIVIGERTIVTPAARDMGEQHRVFVQAAWRG